MTEWASAEAVERAAQEWSDSVVQCRAFGHGWRPQTALHRPGMYTITQRCPRCRVRRWKRINERGYSLTPWHTDYSEATGYLLKGVGRLGTDGKAVLTLLHLAVTGVIQEAVEDETA